MIRNDIGFFKWVFLIILYILLPVVTIMLFVVAILQKTIPFMIFYALVIVFVILLVWLSREDKSKGGKVCNCSSQDDKQVSKIIINSKTEYKPEIIDSSLLKLSDKTPNPQNDERRYLIFTKEAYDNLCKSIGWGYQTRKNKVEQGGVLVGRVQQYKNEIYAIVENSLLADTKGSPAFVEFTSEMWADMQEKLSEINEKKVLDKKLFIIGWFHTHPNSLPVFMSGTDMNTQRLNFSQDWQVSLILNPHTKSHGAFFGLKAMEGKIVVN